MNFEQNDNSVIDMKSTPTTAPSYMSPRNNTQDQEVKGKGYVIWEVIKFFILAIIIVAPIRFFIAQPFIVQGSSMDPTFADGQYLIVDEITYRFDDPKRGDVIVLRYPEKPSLFFIKRLIGLPGDTLTLKNGIVSIITEEDPEPFVLDEPYVVYPKTDNKYDRTITLGDEEYFVMGDNRASSSDSREWGTLPENLIVGRTMLRLFPIDTAAFFPGFPDE